MGLHLARIHSPGPNPEDHIPETQQPDNTKKGWLQVIYKGGIRFARPCYTWGRFTPPTTLWLEKYADKFGVWVIPEETEHSIEREDHLVYLGFDPFEDTLPQDILAAFPEKKLAFTDRWEVVVDDGSADPSFSVRYKGDPSDPAKGGDANPHPTDGSVVLKISQKDGFEAITLSRIAPGVAGNVRTDVLIDKDEVRVSHQDAQQEIILRANEVEVILDSGAGFKVVGNGANAILTLGDGLKHAAVVETLEIFYTALKGKLDAADYHVHPTGMGPSGPPDQKVAASAWDGAINSTKVAFPDG